MAPVAVAPDWQRQGIGSSLVRWSLEQCRQLGHAVVLVVGNPAYYSRFGFTTASPFGIDCPFSVPPEAFMVLELSPGAASGCRGMVCYRPEFDSF
jgi:putative acetyltransferase